MVNHREVVVMEGQGEDLKALSQVENLQNEHLNK